MNVTDLGRDALPGIGHACGHNLIAMASLSAALATKELMVEEEIGGKVVIFGTPAEEGLYRLLSIPSPSMKTSHMLDTRGSFLLSLDQPLQYPHPSLCSSCKRSYLTPSQAAAAKSSS